MGDWPIYLNALLALALVAKLRTVGLARLYRIFSLFLTLDVARALAYQVIFRAGNDSWDYRVLWVAVRPLQWTLYIWMAIAVLRSIMARQTGLLGFSEKVFWVAIGASAAVSVAASVAVSSFTTFHDLLALGFTLERAIATTSFLLLVFMLGYFLYYPVPLPRNLVLFSIGYVVFFGLRLGAFLLAGTFTGPELRTISDINNFGEDACLTFWLLFLSRKGETIETRVGHAWRPDQQEHLMEQLTAINTTLLRSARRL